MKLLLELMSIAGAILEMGYLRSLLRRATVLRYSEKLSHRIACLESALTQMYPVASFSAAIIVATAITLASA